MPHQPRTVLFQKIEMDSNFKSQILDLELVIETKPRTYVKWKNTEDGRDKTNCYERITDRNIVFYMNTNNDNYLISSHNPFFKTLEDLYNLALEAK